MDPVDLSDQPIGAAPNWLNNYVDVYTQGMQTYLTRTAGQVPDLVEYLQWFMARRDSTLTSMTGGMNPTAGTAFRANWGYQQFPWFWQLADQEAIRAFTGEALVSPSDPLIGPSIGSELSATFSPLTQSMLPGEQAEVTVSLPPTDFGGMFDLVVTIPVGIDLVDVPMCTASGACADSSLDLAVENVSDGSTRVSMSGLLHDEPALLVLGLRVAESTPSGTTMTVMATVSFGSHSAPISESVVSTLDVIVK